MKWTVDAAVALFVVVLVASTANADNFVFDIEYLGDDQTSLAPGSDEPDGLSLEVGDTFQWTIASADDRFWLVETGGTFFPLMGINVSPSAVRTGDFSLSLRNDGVEVFAESGVGVTTQEVHLGTNTIVLPTGLLFDEMFLDYELTAVDPIDPLDPATTILDGRLPIFGAPENNQFSPGIVFVPEPAAALLAALACVGVALRRR